MEKVHGDGRKVAHESTPLDPLRTNDWIGFWGARSSGERFAGN
jgi:hypothetical protein